MRIFGINSINISYKPQSFKSVQTNPILKDVFVMQNNTNNISFGKKKDKSKQDKTQLYKQFRKAGCGEKDTHAVINNDKRYKQLLALMGRLQDFERELTPKEMLSIISNEFDDEQIKRFINLTGKKPPATRKLSQKEAVSVIKNNVENEKVQRFIDLKKTDENGNSLLSRPLTNYEACLVCNYDFDNMQAQTYIDVQNLQIYFPQIEFLQNKNNVERFTTLTRKDEQGQTIASRELTAQEAVQVTLANFDNEQVQRFIDLTENKEDKNTRALTYKEAENVIKNGLDEAQIQKFIDTKNYIKGLKNIPDCYYANISDDGISLAVKENFDEKRLVIFTELSSRFWEDTARTIITDKGKYERLLSLIEGTSSIKKKFSITEAGYVIRENLDDVQTKIFKDLVDCKVKNYDAIEFVKDQEKATKYLEYTNKDIIIISRSLTPNEALTSISENFDYKQIQELINIRDKNPNLKLDYIALLIKFIDFKDKTDISELNKTEKRSFLKLLVKYNAFLFNNEISKDTYPLIPKNHEDYCNLIPKLTSAIGLNTEPLSKQEKDDFFNGLNYFINTTRYNISTQFYVEQVLKGLPEIKDKERLRRFDVLRYIASNPDFHLLNSKDKKILALTALLQNVSTNLDDSSFDAFYILQRFSISEDEQLKIYELIKSSDWFQKLENETGKQLELTAQDIAFDTRHSNTFELAKILSEANIKSKGYLREQQKLSEMKRLAKKVEFYLKKLQETQIFLPQTKIPKASEMKNCEILSADGISNTIFYINQADEDLAKYGFESGTTITNWQGLVHGLSKEEHLQRLTTFSFIDSDALLSTSYMNPREYKVFRKQGLILDVNPTDIHAGYFKDFGSGFQKTTEKLKRHYLFYDGEKDTYSIQDRTKYRNYISKLMKTNLGCNDEEYLSHIKTIQGCKSITDIEKKDKIFAKICLEVFEAMNFGKRRYNRQYNEILVSRPKIQGVFAYDRKYEEIPLFLRKYAQDNDLPIIMFGLYQ